MVQVKELQDYYLQEDVIGEMSGLNLDETHQIAILFLPLVPHRHLVLRMRENFDWASLMDVGSQWFQR